MAYISKNEKFDLYIRLKREYFSYTSHDKVFKCRKKKLGQYD